MVVSSPGSFCVQLTGFIVVKQLWGDLMRHTFEPSVSGIDVIFHSDDDSAHAFHITAGEVEYVGPGWDHHEKNAKFQMRDVKLNGNIFTNSTVSYHMDIYSTQEFVETAGSFGQSDSNVPVTACVVAVGIMLFTSLLFVLYDNWVRKIFNAKKKLLDAKRQFVRFISHEVRTPLNTICMGLTLLQNDLKAVAGTNRSQHGSTDDESQSASENNLSSGRTSSITSTNTFCVDQSQVKEWVKLSGEIASNAESAVSVLSDLLNYDKIQMGALTLELSPINPWKLLEEHVGEFKMAAKEKNVRLRLDLSPLLEYDLERSFHETVRFKKTATTTTNEEARLITAMDLPTEVGFLKVIADDVRLAQVLRNLMSNALKFTRKGGKISFFQRLYELKDCLFICYKNSLTCVCFCDRKLDRPSDNENASETKEEARDDEVSK